MAPPAERPPSPPDRAAPAPATAGPVAGRAELCRSEAAAECPACASPMRLWAAYYRCRNCGYKESCCF